MIYFAATAYAFSWMALAVSAVLWFVFKRALLGTKFPRLLLTAFAAAYGVSLLLANGFYEDFYLIPNIVRDVVLLAAVGVLSKLISKDKFALLLVLAGIGAAGYFKYFSYLRAQAGYLNSKAPAAGHDITPAESAAPLTGAASEAEFLFDPKSSGDLTAILELLAPYNVRVEKAFPEVVEIDATELDDYYAVDIPAAFEQRGAEIFDLIERSGKTESLEINTWYTLDPQEMQTPTINLTPSGEPYAVNDPYADSLRQFRILGFREFYQSLNGRTPAKKARLAILDTGVDAGHEDLRDNYVSLGAKNDRDVQGHGTHCAGIAAAVTNNGVGIASMAGAGQWVEVSGIKVLNDSGSGSEQTIIAGIVQAADSGADVVSMSLGGRGGAAAQRAYDQAIQYANRKGAIVVVAAGNENRQARTRLPASSPYAITVSAVDDTGRKAPFSNFFVDYEKEFGIAAPGVGIFSTLPNNRYARFSGTSMATPCVAGIVAVLKALRPELTTGEAYQILNSTGADTENTGRTGRLVQPAAALLSVF